jgi:hypothetical protein
MIRLVSTLRSARRAWAGPILRLLDETGEAFVVGMTGCGIVSAIANEQGHPSKVDGSIEVLELMAGGTNGMTKASRAVLAMIDQLRDEGIAGFDMADLLRGAQDAVTRARSGPLDHRRLCATEAAAKLIIAVEQLDRELGS